MQDREVYLADIKKRADEYRAQKTSAQASAFAAGAMSTPVAAKGGFNF